MPTTPTDLSWWEPTLRNAWPYATYGIAAFLPLAVLMTTAYVRIHVVMLLLRQSLGNPQVPGNQILMILSLLLTGVIMQPIGIQVHQRGIAPYAAGQLPFDRAWEAGIQPLKRFMVDQVAATRHEHYLLDLYDATVQTQTTPNSVVPEYMDQLPLHVILTAFLLSELTTAFWIGFTAALPFLVIDLVTASTLSAMGLFLVPPAQISVPIKLAVFTLAEGWWLVSDMLMRSFTFR